MSQQAVSEVLNRTQVLLELSLQDFRRESDGSWVTTRQINIGTPGAERMLIGEGRRFSGGQMFLLGLDLAEVLEKQCA